MKDGKLVVDSNGQPIECDTCPCDQAVEETPPECEVCDGSAPSTWTLELTGYTNCGGCDCTDCTGINGTHILEFYANMDCPTSISCTAGCSWRKVIAADDACGYDVTLELAIYTQAGSPGTTFLEFRVYWGDPESVSTDFDFWNGSVASDPLDCCSSYELGIIFFGCADGSSAGAGGTGHCSQPTGFPYCLTVTPGGGAC